MEGPLAPLARWCTCRRTTSPPAPAAGAPSTARARSSAGSPSSSSPPSLGGAVGQRMLADEDTRQRLLAGRRPGDRRRRLPRRRPTSRCSCRRKGSVKVGDAAFTAAVERRRRAARGARRTSTRSSRRYAKGNEGQLSQGRPLRARHLQAPRRRRRRQGPRRRDARRHRRRAAARTRELRIEQFGDASADKALTQGVRRGLQEGRVPLAADHAADPDRRVRRARRRRRAAAARAHRRDGHDRAARPDQPARPDGRVRSRSVVLLVGLAVGVDYSMFYLRREMEERDAGSARRPRSRSPRRPPAAPC